MVLRILSIVLLCALVVAGAPISADSGVNYCVAPDAQTATPEASATATSAANACISPDTLTAAQTACESIAAGQVCLGAGEVQGLTVVGAALDYSTMQTLTSSSGSLALLKMQADLPDSAAPISLALYGDAAITNTYTGAQAPFPTVTIQNSGLNTLNLRATPSLTGTIVGTMPPNSELTVDGRSADGAWLRVQRDTGTAWIYASLVTVKAGDDANTLIVADSPITQPFQSLTLESSDAAAACGGGLLIEAANIASAHLEINGALLTFSTATLLLQAQSDAALTVQVIKGSVDLAVNADALTVKAGSAASVALSGSQASAAPALSDHSAFVSLASAPLALLSQAASSCIAGVSDGTAALYRTPGASQSSGELDAASSAIVTGQTKTSEGKVWLLVGSTWVLADDVQLAGYCEAIPEVSASAAQQTSSASQPAVTFAHDQVPDGRSIWQAHTGPDNLSGVCTAPPIAQCDHLAAVTTQANGTITWLGQEPAPYTLRPTGDNTFSYRGRNQLNNANLSLTVTFTGPTSWVGTMNIVYDSDSGCTHTFNYTADRMR